MAGIYLHIPFCRKICGYCDFFKNASLSQKKPLLDAMQLELEMRQSYLQEPVETIYFGGGTPSVLQKQEVALLLESISSNFKLGEELEITFESNPDDLNLQYLTDLKELGINRLSIGIQSFDDEVLKFMNRRHTAQEAIDCVEIAQKVGFENLSLDFIYGIPNTEAAYLQRNLKELCLLNPSHISAYHLTIEQGTPFAHLKKKGKLSEIADENSERQYAYVSNYLRTQGYEQYEISNFCKDNQISRHNSSYWMQKSYLGIGPSAHSYDKTTRHWNLSNLKQYISSIEKGSFPSESEVLNTKDKYNDYMMVRLRTKWGIDLAYIEHNFGTSFSQRTQEIVEKHLTDFSINASHILLKPEAFLRSDYLISKFFVI